MDQIRCTIESRRQRVVPMQQRASARGGIGTAVCRARHAVTRAAFALAWIALSAASAQPAPTLVEKPGATEPPAADPVVVAPRPPRIQIHGFASEGAFVSTANDYLGSASRGSLELFDAGINFSTEVADRLRA